MFGRTKIGLCGVGLSIACVGIYVGGRRLKYVNNFCCFSVKILWFQISSSLQFLSYNLKE